LEENVYLDCQCLRGRNTKRQPATAKTASAAATSTTGDSAVGVMSTAWFVWVRGVPAYAGGTELLELLALLVDGDAYVPMLVSTDGGGRWRCLYWRTRDPARFHLAA
jgi:hypothetical protein